MGREKRGELSRSPTGKTRLPAFSLHLPNQQGPQGPQVSAQESGVTTLLPPPHRDFECREDLQEHFVLWADLILLP